MDAINARSHFNLQFIRHTRTKENFRLYFFFCVRSISVSLKCQIPRMWHTRIHVHAGCWHIWHVFVVYFDKLLFKQKNLECSMKDFTVWLYFAILHCWFSDIMPFIAKYSTSNLILTWGFTFCSCITIPMSQKFILFCLCSYYLKIWMNVVVGCRLKSNSNLNTLKIRCSNVMISMVKIQWIFCICYVYS